MTRLWIGVVLGVCMHVVQADTSTDDEALALANRTVDTQVTGSGLRMFAEGGVIHGVDASGAREGGVVTLDLRAEVRLASATVLVLSDRFDRRLHPAAPMERSEVNALREAYVDWRSSPVLSARAGRINLRKGVAYGYNPTDFFRTRALRSTTSIDPDAIRNNRMGVVGVQGLGVWEGGAASVMVAPRLADTPDASPFSLDLGSTNSRAQALLTLTKDIGSFKPEFILLVKEQQSPQFGLNLTGLIGQSTVAYVEWSGGRGRSMRAVALDLSERDRFRQRATVGLNYTTASKLSLTAEASYNGAGFDASGWRALQSQGSEALTAVLLLARDTLDPPSRQSWFFRAVWKDFGLARLDLSAFLRLSRADRSQQRWAELRYRVGPSDEVYAQLQHNRGAAGSVYGSAGPTTVVGAFYRHYFF
jgi:hypothetical protein